MGSGEKEGGVRKGGEGEGSVHLVRVEDDGRNEVKEDMVAVCPQRLEEKLVKGRSFLCSHLMYTMVVLTSSTLALATSSWSRHSRNVLSPSFSM